MVLSAEEHGERHKMTASDGFEEDYMPWEDMTSRLIWLMRPDLYGSSASARFRKENMTEPKRAPTRLPIDEKTRTWVYWPGQPCR